MKQDTNGNCFEVWLQEYRTRLQDVAEHGCNIIAANRNGGSEAAEGKPNVGEKKDSASPSAPADDFFLHFRPTTNTSESLGLPLKHV